VIDLQKKTLLLIIILSMLFNVTNIVQPVLAQDVVSVYLNGTSLTFRQPPIIESGHTLVPLRGIFEALGAVVTWNNEAQTVEAVKDSVKVNLTIGNNIAYINKRPAFLQSPATIVNGSTLVPLRFVSEVFGSHVSWDGVTRSIFITTPLEKAKFTRVQ